MLPWGRLTLQSARPRMDDNVSSSTLYYTPFENNEPELSVSLVGIVAGNLYDVYVGINGTLFLTSAWTNPTTPSVSKTKNGNVWYDNINNMYVGTIHAAANDIVKWQPRPSRIAGGCNNELGIFNAYNRLPIVAINQDTTSSWSYAGGGAIRYANNSSAFRINWVDGLGDVFCEGVYETSVAGIGSNAVAATVGVGLNQNAYPVNWTGYFQQAAMNSGSIGCGIKGNHWVNGLRGYNNWQAMEQSTAYPITFFGNDFACLTVRLEV